MNRESIGEEMKKIILVDGNNLLYRSYYATAYSGSLLRNSKGFPTNALYGFIGMMNKIIHEEKPEYIAVAFDIGKNFRKEKYPFYKEGRKKTPEELHMQEPYARKILKAMGVPYFELAPYEADDIIGTFAQMVLEDDDFEGCIISSDRDLLQLVSPQLEMKLLKQKDYIRYNMETFQKDYGMDPIHIIDLKALAGDSSDNIPGVSGIGEKTALNLLHEYGTLEGIYENIDKIKGKTKEKLENDKDKAFMSKEIATIYREVPLDIKDLENIRYTPLDGKELEGLYEELEFYSFLKNLRQEEVATKKFAFEKVTDKTLLDEKEYALYLELDGNNYHQANIIGMGLSSEEKNYFVSREQISSVLTKIADKVLYTYDLKKNIVALNRLNIKMPSCNTDLMILKALLDDSSKDDIAFYMVPNGYNVNFLENIWKKDIVLDESLEKEIALKARFIYDTRDRAILDIKRDDMYELFKNIEMPLAPVLADMEITGVKVDKTVLEEMKKEAKDKINILTKEIHELAGEEFNIASPKQLGEILFIKLGLPGGKKTEKGYKTDVKVLHKLLGVHPIIAKVLEYRNVRKLYDTYLEGMQNYIMEDGKIHTIFKQNFARTGRLSSTEPNLQNIPVRDEEGKKIRKAFLPVNDLFLSADYSQIELRILAHISGSKELQEAFINDQDIHTKVASDIYGIPEKEVSKKMRSTAKAVIFGIVYGISGYGLGENLEISSKEAKEFIEKYYELYPGVKKYMDEIVKEAILNGSVRTLLKRRRIIPELNSPQYMVRQMGERIALNTPIQGTSADIIKKAMVEIYDELKKQNLKSKMILQVHDELIFDLIEEEKEQVEKIVKDKMTHTITLDVPLKVSADYGVNWYDTK
ncbi:DNA polymerase I [bacterium]|nr:DNA polymerase I [bacterium]